MPHYYVAIERQQYGPYTLEQLLQQPLPPGALIWREGLAAWLPLHQIPEIAARLSPPIAPPVQPAGPISVQVAPAAAPSVNLRFVAEKQRALMFTLAGCCAAYFFGFTCIGVLLESSPDGAAPPDEGAAALALLLRLAIAAGICAAQVWACLGLAQALRLPQPFLWAFGSVFCCLGWFVLLALSQRASTLLRRAGYKVGLMGASLKQFP